MYGQCLIMQTNEYSEWKKKQEESSQSPPKSGWATGEARALMNKGAGKRGGLHFGVERAKSGQVWWVWLQAGTLHVPLISVLTHPLSPPMPSQSRMSPTLGALHWKWNVIHHCWALCVRVCMVLQKQLLWLWSSLIPLHFRLVDFPLVLRGISGGILTH